MYIYNAMSWLLSLAVGSCRFSVIFRIIHGGHHSLRSEYLKDIVPIKSSAHVDSIWIGIVPDDILSQVCSGE